MTGDYLVRRHAEFARFYAPLAVLLAVLSFAPLYSDVTMVRDGRVRLLMSEDPLWSLSSGHSTIGGLLLMVLVMLLLVASVYPVRTGVLGAIAVLALLLGLCLALRLGRPEGMGLLAATGRLSLGILFSTTVIAAVHATITHVHLSQHPTPRRPREPTV